MNNGQKIIEIATNEIGIKETPPNSNCTKYGEWFGLNGVAWCGIFVSYCFAKAGFPLKGWGYAKGYAGCQTAYIKALKDNLIVTQPQQGDIILFDWNGDKRFEHTGIFVKDNGDGKTFTSIEGNTGFTNQSNGGQVMERNRFYKTATFL